MIGPKLRDLIVRMVTEFSPRGAADEVVKRAEDAVLEKFSEDMLAVEEEITKADDLAGLVLGMVDCTPALDAILDTICIELEVS